MAQASPDGCLTRSSNSTVGPTLFPKVLSLGPFRWYCHIGVQPCVHDPPKPGSAHDHDGSADDHDDGCANDYHDDGSCGGSAGYEPDHCSSNYCSPDHGCTRYDGEATGDNGCAIIIDRRSGR